VRLLVLDAQRPMNTVLWAVGGVLLLVVLAIGWVAGMVTRNRGRRRALMFADTMLGNADSIKASVAAGYPLTECLAVLDAFYKVHSPSTMLDVPTLVNMLRKRREADGGVATGINTVSSAVYSRMRHLLSPRGDRSVQTAWPLPPTPLTPAVTAAMPPPGVSPAQIELGLAGMQLSLTQGGTGPPQPTLAGRAAPTSAEAATEQLVECAVAAGFSRHLARQSVAEVQREAPSMMPLERRTPPLRLLLLLERRRQEHAQFVAFERLAAIAEVAQPLLDKLGTLLGAPHAVLLTALYATATSSPGTPRAVAAPPSSSAASRTDGDGRDGGGGGGGGGGDAPLSELNQREEGVHAAFARAEERWHQVRSFVPVLGNPPNPMRQQQQLARMQILVEAAAAYPPCDVLHEATELERETDSDARGGELWRRRLWRRLQRAAEARDELLTCERLQRGGLLGLNADVVLTAVFEAAHPARTVVALLVKYYEQHPEDADGEVGVLPLWLEHALATDAAARRRVQAEVTASAAAFSLSASLAFTDAERQDVDGGGSGGGSGSREGAPGEEPAWAAGLGTWWGLDSERAWEGEGGLAEELGSTDDEEGTASTCTSDGADSAEEDMLGLLPDEPAPDAPVPALALPLSGSSEHTHASADSSARTYIPGEETYRRDGLVAFGTAPPRAEQPRAVTVTASPPPSPPPSPPAPATATTTATTTASTYSAGVAVLPPGTSGPGALPPSPRLPESSAAASSSSSAPAAPAPPVAAAQAQPASSLLMTPAGRALMRSSAPLLRHALVNGCPPGVLHTCVCDWLAELPADATASPALPEHVVSALLERVRAWRSAPPPFATPPPFLWKAALDLNRAEIAHAWAEGAHWGATLYCLATYYAETPQALARRQPISMLELARRLESLSQESLDWSAPLELTHPRGPNRTALALAARRGYPPLLASRTLHEAYLADRALLEAAAPVPQTDVLLRLRAKRQLHKQQAAL